MSLSAIEMPFLWTDYLKASLRLLLLLYLVLSLPWDCTICLGILAASYYFLQSDHEVSRTTNVFNWSVNPFKGKVGRGYLTQEENQAIDQKVSELVLYDAADVQSVKNFDKIKQNSECSFAKRAKLWGSPDYEIATSLEEYTRRLAPTFYKFTIAFQSLGLDAFLIELPGLLYCADIKVFGAAVRRVLLTLREIDLERRWEEIKKDPHYDQKTINEHLKLFVEDSTSWNRKNWVFEFNKTTFFITTFAPFYPETNSRFSFGSEHGYILFQPEISFAIHDLPPDSAHTNWLCPKHVRDRIRIAFREAGREYDPPMKVGEPMVCEIVKRVDPDDDLIQWWLPELTMDEGKMNRRKWIPFE